MVNMNPLDRAVLNEVREVAKNNKIKNADVMEWSTAKCEPHEGETYYFLPVLQVHCCVKLPTKKG